MRILIVSLCTFCFGLVLTALARKVAHRTGMVAAPRQDRWHQKPTALLGGTAIYAAFVIGYAIFMPKFPASYPLLAGGSLLFFTGLIDDFMPIKPYAKLIIQLMAAAMVVYFGLHLPWVNYQWVNDFLTIFWLVGITNAINLLDNMDGLAGGVSLISCAFLAITLLLNGQTTEAMLPVLLGGAALGFLVFNFSPASIFMGDCGSMFLGFMLSGIALMSDTGRFGNLSSVLLTPVLILMIPIFDTCIVTITRKLSGRPISQGGRDHSSHRLVALGVSERRAVLLLYLFAAVSGALALLVRRLATPVVMVLVPIFALTVLFLGLYLGKVRIYEDGAPSQAVRLVNAVAGFTYKRRIFEVLLDVVLVMLAYYGAYVLRWDGRLPDEQFAIFVKTLPLVIIIEMAMLLFGGMYKGLWRYVGIKDQLNIAKSVIAGSALSAVVVFVMYWFRGPSRAIFLINPLLLLALVSASRFSFRLLREMIVGNGGVNPDATPVLIYGAGDGGELLIREILNNPVHGYAPIGFIDDDNHKAGKVMHGYRIFGSNDLHQVIHRYGIREILISSLKVPESKLESLRGLGVDLKKMSIRIE